MVSKWIPTRLPALPPSTLCLWISLEPDEPDAADMALTNEGDTRSMAAFGTVQPADATSAHLGVEPAGRRLEF